MSIPSLLFCFAWFRPLLFLSSKNCMKQFLDAVSRTSGIIQVSDLVSQKRHQIRFTPPSSLRWYKTTFRMRIASLTTRNFTCLSILTVQDQAMALEAMKRCISDVRKRMYRTNLCGVTNVVNVFPATWKLFRWLTCVVVWGGGVTYKQVKIVINKWKRKKKEKKERKIPKEEGDGRREQNALSDLNHWWLWII